MHRRSVLALGTSVVLGITFAIGGVSASASATTHKAHVAHMTANVSSAASHGGRVIVILRNQYKG